MGSSSSRKGGQSSASELLAESDSSPSPALSEMMIKQVTETLKWQMQGLQTLEAGQLVEVWDRKANRDVIGEISYVDSGKGESKSISISVTPTNQCFTKPGFKIKVYNQDKDGKDVKAMYQRYDEGDIEIEIQDKDGKFCAGKKGLLKQLLDYQVFTEFRATSKDEVWITKNGKEVPFESFRLIRSGGVLKNEYYFKNTGRYGRHTSICLRLNDDNGKLVEFTNFVDQLRRLASQESKKSKTPNYNYSESTKTLKLKSTDGETYTMEFDEASFNHMYVVFTKKHLMLRMEDQEAQEPPSSDEDRPRTASEEKEIAETRKLFEDAKRRDDLVRDVTATWNARPAFQSEA